MQIRKILITTIILIGFTNLSFSLPPFQVLQTCMKGKPYNDKSTIIMLDDAGAAEQPFEGCEDQYDFKFNGHTYGMLTCQDKFYLIINDKKIDSAQAKNLSINPEIQPGEAITPRALWYKIDYENNSYLCILAPLAEQGVGAARNQYYIVENAFDETLTPKLYFYFFDKNITPITSKYL
jgi:hypothetical protein